MLFWSDAVHVTIAGAGMTRDVGGGVNNNLTIRQRKRIAGSSIDGNGNVGRSGRSAWQTLQGRQPSSTRAPPIICIAVSSAVSNIDPPLAPHCALQDALGPYNQDGEGQTPPAGHRKIHALRLLGLGNAIDHRFACDITKDWKTIVFNNSRPRVRYF
jgi:hypothetical protein